MTRRSTRFPWLDPPSPDVAHPPARAPLKTLTLHFKVRPNAWPWLDQAADEVNTVWNWANETCRRNIQRFAGPIQWLSASHPPTVA